ncbi:spore protease YyaC [Tepidimicrobium xylanilyticum]|uniref:Putative sporulation protein YyaC n=1 Tax=Tepidimicrobium xylanilyticum TaxID=1123352 RepID=A0A1H3AKP5_9FIRM|nr:spore protease YyaC [Tepidimicrobium xylanilyticum]GMG98084.1 spore protease YyaC [Tepidimicrobium xylanilyticum]SDX30021.1 putative sporulation protein YyaC [Tepidimicrobium xylanilyticum]
MLNYSNNYIDSRSSFAVFEISNLISRYIAINMDNKQDLIILCIGTDRSTGDSLGPLVGYKLAPHIQPFEQVYLFGTLEEPVHAKNLEDITHYINSQHPNPFILAIDASLGNMDKIGYINIKKGPLKPGLGVNKNLPPVGDISITGVVNVGGMMEYIVLQNTRLSLVMNMANIIYKGIYKSLLSLYNQKYQRIF